MRVVALVYTGVTSKEVLGPLGAMAPARPDVTVVSTGTGPCFGVEPAHTFRVTHTVFAAPDPTDVLLVPGGLGSITMSHNDAIAEWLVAAAPLARCVLSVSTGSLLLAAAGLLTGQHVSGHWLAKDALVEVGALPADDAVTTVGKYITTAGAASATHVAGRLHERLVYGPTG